MDADSGRVFYDKLTYIYLEMPKFRKTEEELETHFDKWLYVLKNLHLLTSEQEYQNHENSLKYYRDLKNSIDTAFDEGKIEGEQLGREKGRREGRVEGEQLGREKTAGAMKEKGIELSVIAEVTGLSAAEIEKL
jgi:predicted transposase/invertase (TIGR01784 family)